MHMGVASVKWQNSQSLRFDVELDET
jgi:hypothetical protein